MVDTYLRMPSEFRRIMDSHKRGVRRLGYLLSHEELNRLRTGADPAYRTPKT